MDRAIHGWFGEETESAGECGVDKIGIPFMNLISNALNFRTPMYALKAKMRIGKKTNFKQNMTSLEDKASIKSSKKTKKKPNLIKWYSSFSLYSYLQFFFKNANFENIYKDIFVNVNRFCIFV
jgi:hypothetical protein